MAAVHLEHMLRAQKKKKKKKKKNPSRREGGDCGFTLSRSHSCCAVWLVYTQISPGHI
jgi:CelD/BcsL family acetyltransferase involved in cellulose biosynthesis